MEQALGTIERELVHPLYEYAQSALVVDDDSSIYGMFQSAAIGRMGRFMFETNTIGWARLSRESRPTAAMGESWDPPSNWLSGYQSAAAWLTHNWPDENAVSDAIWRATRWGEFRAAEDAWWKRFGEPSYTGNGPFCPRVRAPFRPTHLTGDLAPVDKSFDEQLDETFGWEDVVALDPQRSRTYIGAPTFRALLDAQVRQEPHEDVRILRFVHREESPAWYSYAIYLGPHEVQRGWVVLLQVGGDYSGLGGRQRDYVENTIEYHRGRVAVEEYEIPLRELNRYAWRFEVESTKLAEAAFDLRTDLRNLRTAHGDLVGLSLELCTKYVIDQESSTVRTEISYRHARLRPLNGEIDVLVHRKDGIAVVEVTTDFGRSRLDGLIDEFSQKRDSVATIHRVPIESIFAILVVRREDLGDEARRSDATDTLRAAGIALWTIEEDIVPRLPKRFRAPLARLSARGSSQRARPADRDI